MYDLRSLSTNTATGDKYRPLGLFILYAGPMVFIMLMCILFILSGHRMLSGCNATLIEFNPSEVPSDSLFFKQCDSVSESGESVKSVVIRA